MVMTPETFISLIDFHHALTKDAARDSARFDDVAPLFVGAARRGSVPQTTSDAVVLHASVRSPGEALSARICRTFSVNPKGTKGNIRPGVFGSASQTGRFPSRRPVRHVNLPRVGFLVVEIWSG